MREHKGQSIIALPAKYTVIDIETTGLDFEYCHIIEVAAVKFEDGKIVDTFSSLVKPPLERTYFPLRNDGAGEWVNRYVDEFISDLTGITNEMLECAPAPADVIPKLREFLGDSVLIAHNANFDINFLYDAIEQHCNAYLTNNFIDTLRIARKVFPELSHHRLSDIATACQVDQSEAHRAEADCLVTGKCYEFMRNHTLTKSSEEEFQKLFKQKSLRHKNSLLSMEATTEDIDDTNPIYQKVIVFTGALSAMSRKEAFQLSLNLGAIPEDSITKKTNYLVIGSEDFAKSVTDGKTSKMKKAENYQQKGAEIYIISENAFFDLISEYI